MRADVHFERCDLAIHGFGNFGAVPPVDQACRQMPDQVDDMFPDGLFKQLFKAWPDARQPRNRRKNRKEDFGPHGFPSIS